MALYSEIRGLFNDSDLRNRVEVAVIIAANGLADNPANNAWVADAYSTPTAEAKKALMAVLATNNGMTVDAIKTADDDTLQTAVNSVVTVLVKAKAGA